MPEEDASSACLADVLPVSDTVVEVPVTFFLNTNTYVFRSLPLVTTTDTTFSASFFPIEILPAELSRMDTVDPEYVGVAVMVTDSKLVASLIWYVYSFLLKSLFHVPLETVSDESVALLTAAVLPFVPIFFTETAAEVFIAVVPADKELFFPEKAAAILKAVPAAVLFKACEAMLFPPDV